VALPTTPPLVVRVYDHLQKKNHVDQATQLNSILIPPKGKPLTFPPLFKTARPFPQPSNLNTASGSGLIAGNNSNNDLTFPVISLGGGAADKISDWKPNFLVRQCQ
jgi:hypothetical protein